MQMQIYHWSTMTTNLLKNKVEKGQPYNLSYSLDDIFQSEVPSKQSRKPIWPS